MIFINYFSRYDFKRKLTRGTNFCNFSVKSGWLTVHKAVTKSCKISLASKFSFEVITTKLSYQMNPCFLKGIGQYFEIFFLAKFHLSGKNWMLIYKYKKKNSKFLSKSEEIINFVKHALSGDEANLYSCCCLKHGYSKPKCHNLHNVQLIFGSVQRTAQTGFRIFLHTRIMVDGNKFSSHDSGGHF